MPRAAVILCVLLSVSPLLAGDWPQWLGPNRDGVSEESVKPWRGPLKVLWRQAVGEGHSSPVVAAGRVFTHAKVAGQEGEEVVAWDVGTGKRLWRQAHNRPAFSNFFGNGPRSTPLVDGERVYTLGVSGVLACWKTAPENRETCSSPTVTGAPNASWAAPIAARRNASESR